MKPLLHRTIYILVAILCLCATPCLAGESSNSLPQDAQNIPGNTPGESQTAHDRALFVLNQKLDLTDAENKHFMSNGLWYDFDDNGHATKITFQDGYSFDVTYEYRADGILSAAVLTHNYIAVKFVLAPGAVIVSDATPVAAPPPLPASIPTPKSAGSHSARTLGFTDEQPKNDFNSPKTSLKETSISETKKQPVIMIVIEQDAATFSQLIQSLNRSFIESKFSTEKIAQSKLSIPTLGADSGLDILAIKETVKGLERSQKKFLVQYEKSTEAYYDRLEETMAQDLALKHKIKDKEAKQTTEPHTNRQVVDQTVQQVLKDPSFAARQDKWIKQIRATQPALYQQYVEKSQKDLKIAMETSFEEFVEKLHKILPVKSQIHIEGDITEIILYLSTLSK